MPSRKLTEYYSVIKHPTSINKVMAKVKGFRGRGDYSGTSDFRTWDAFENEVKKIWDNARLFNEDGSEIFVLSEELEVIRCNIQLLLVTDVEKAYFRKRLMEAKKFVDEPPQPTLKLNMPKAATNSIKIRLGSQKASPSPASRPSTSNPGVSVDESALQRQRQAVMAASGSLTQAASIEPASRPTTSGAAASPALNSIKTESQRGPSPSSSDAQGRPISQSSNPGKPLYGSQPPGQAAQSNYVPPPPSGFDNKFRKEGQGEQGRFLGVLNV